MDEDDCDCEDCAVEVPVSRFRLMDAVVLFFDFVNNLTRAINTLTEKVLRSAIAHANYRVDEEVAEELTSDDVQIINGG